MADEKETVEAKVRSIRRATREKYSAEEKMRIVLQGARRETSIRELCWRKGIPTRLRRCQDRVEMSADHRDRMSPDDRMKGPLPIWVNPP